MKQNPVVRSSLKGDCGSLSQRLPSILLLLPLLLPAACNEPSGQVLEISEGEVLTDSRFPAKATMAQRFGFASPQAGNMAAGAAQDHGPDYTFALPDGWTELPPSQFRQVNFGVAGSDETQCYLTVLDGDGGGLAANVNRWRGQMQLESLDDGALAALPKGELLGSEATVFDATGTFAGMGGEGNAEGSRMIGLLAFTGAKSLFFKIVGPESVVVAQKASFEALAQSLTDAHAGHNHGPAGAESMAQANAPAMAAAVPVGAAATTGDGLSWDAPQGWQVTAPRPMRLINYDVGGGGDNQCYISILGGDGGGAMANINRWRQQMGQSTFGADEFAALERIPMLDGSALMVEIEGNFTGMGTDAVDVALMLGVIRELPERTVFVKMIGDRDALSLERDSFLEFCQSIRFADGG